MEKGENEGCKSGIPKLSAPDKYGAHLLAMEKSTDVGVLVLMIRLLSVVLALHQSFFPTRSLGHPFPFPFILS